MTNPPRMPDAKPIALEERAQMSEKGAHDARLSSPSAGRNREVVRDVLVRVLPPNAKVLEIGSGTGEHAVCFAAARPDVSWNPSELDLDSRASVEAWTTHEGLPNIAPPRVIDTRHPAWGVEDDAPFDALVSLNMIHIAPWEACLGLLAGAERLLRPGGILFLYGPFARGGQHTASSNAAFDESLKRRDPTWGVRDLDDVMREAEARGLALTEIVDMPANNLSVVFARL